MALSYIDPTIWSKTSDTLKRTKNLNTFKHNLKEHYIKELKNSTIDYQGSDQVVLLIA